MKRCIAPLIVMLALGCDGLFLSQGKLPAAINEATTLGAARATALQGEPEPVRLRLVGIAYEAMQAAHEDRYWDGEMEAVRLGATGLDQMQIALIMADTHGLGSALATEARNRVLFQYWKAFLDGIWTGGTP